ncbi:MAG: GPW/gp25 family protein [Myxococcales bacterium]|nr:GPW/gp25 family protein [Myxococcales bacterium]MCB9580292.1 GPW/gp25 family protein [Polyangiaceae bacterium]
MKPTSILGRGVRFPFRPGADGRFSLIEGEDNVAQSIVMILSTALGERVMRYELGSELPQLIFEPVNSRTLMRIEESVRSALRDFEKRIIVRRVVAAPDQQIQSKVNVVIEYDIPRTNRRGNLVFPFYLQGG